ncbi:MAG TPA: ABC transporter ATP-binding protein [Acidimicrobiales bacterium]|nr:ABC transporter ATP-binding protein [Acidimicrobiales bacterium]
MAAAVVLDHVSKRYRLYHERNDSLKSSFLNFRRGRYEEHWAVRDLSLEIETGSTFGIIGENGSGKSTLLKCMARILTPDAGTIQITGKVSALLELGAGFSPELTGRDNVYLNGAILGLPRSVLDKKLDEIVAFSGLESFIDIPVKNYSSGMFVRLGFAVAINVDPDVLLVDEVLAVGDEEFQRRCEQKFADLRASGRTIVIVSHAMGTMRNICDQLAWLNQGRLRDVGEPGNVVDEYVEEVHAAAGPPPDPEGGARWGSGEISIDAVELVDNAGGVRETTRTGDSVRLRLHYTAHKRVERPVFGVGVHRLDGIHITGPNTKQADLRLDAIDGSGHVDLVLDRLLLLPGTYDLSAAAYDWTLQHAYDHRHRFQRFDVERGEPTEEHGLVSLGGRWDTSRIGTSQKEKGSGPPPEVQNESAI